jgi:hypothetical protein
VTIGVGVERFGVVLKRFADFYDDSPAPDFGATLLTGSVAVPVSTRFAVQARLSGRQRTDITGDHTEFWYDVLINHRIGRATSSRFYPFLTYGLSGLYTRREVPPTPEWVWDGTAWVERTRPAYTVRHHTWPTRPVGGAGFQYDIWKGIATRVEAELIGPSAARLRTSLVIPIGVGFGSRRQ